MFFTQPATYSNDSEADCPTYYGDGLDGVDLDLGLIVKPLDFAHPE
ncbi:hypothetical protein M6B38_340880 [Iris pallida]|uniref:Uncharacterized protein n=1 Tax=Iris pallida TaxID=29817 RepID=A0AAX6GWL3_IRIPA|nr:hypothetical protein M6B38_340875 [Iris pallida]KAJ6833120.1 hypothetical protein M6B38_340880 [Iris pallida]